MQTTAILATCLSVSVYLVVGCGSRSEMNTDVGGAEDPANTMTDTGIDPSTDTATYTDPAVTTSVPCALLAPDLQPVLPAAEDVGGVVVTPLPPFAAPTACDSVIARLYLNDDVAPCEVPSALEVVHWDVDTLDDLAVPPALTFVAPMPESSEWTATERPGVYEIRWHLPTSHGPGDIPLVGVRVRPNLCPVTVECVDPAIRYRTSGEWSTLASGLYFRLADCALAQ